MNLTTNTTSSITIRRPDDFHVHFRQDEDLPAYVNETAKHFARALVMPNTIPPIDSLTALQKYAHAINNSITSPIEFASLMTFKIYPNMQEESIQAMYSQGNAIAAKLYPQGATTNSEDGVSSVKDIFDVASALQERDMVLCIHGEEPSSFVLDREKDFLTSVQTLRENFPKLRIVLEHVSTQDSVEYVCSANSDLLAATVTVHHLLFTLDSVIGNLLNPHMFCKPVLKTPNDLHAIQKVVIQGHKSFFLGTDSAPHHISKKECAHSCAGVFSAPVAMPILADFFESTISSLPDNSPKHSSTGETAPWIIQLEQFTSQFGAEFYTLPLNSKTLTLKRETWQVPTLIHDVVPLAAGTWLNWK